jgi:hypothetical protein
MYRRVATYLKPMLAAVVVYAVLMLATTQRADAAVSYRNLTVPTIGQE